MRFQNGDLRDFGALKPGTGTGAGTAFVHISQFENLDVKIVERRVKNLYVKDALMT